MKLHLENKHEKDHKDAHRHEKDKDMSKSKPWKDNLIHQVVPNNYYGLTDIFQDD